MPSFFAGGSGDGSARRRWTDRIAGILVGVVLGLGVLVYFVFVHSEGTIDAPKVNEGTAATTTGGETTLPAHPGSPEEPAGRGGKQGGASGEGGGEQGEAGEAKSGGRPGTTQKTEALPAVKVIGGEPPTGSGPKQLHFFKGEKARFVIETSEPFTFEIKGLGITQTIESSSTISFKATKTGQFPLIATATLIGVADIQVSKKK